MKITITFNLETEDRHGIAWRFGDSKPADYQRCRSEILAVVETHIGDLRYEWERETDLEEED